MNESHISEETSGSDPCELNADACSFSNEDCRENVEDCLNPEATASDVTAGCTAMRVNAPFVSNEHNYKAEMNLKHIHYHCNKDCRIQEANVWLRDEKLCTVKVTADADECKENVEDCLNAQATASDVATLCKDMDMNASPILDCSAAVATLCRATDMNESPFPEETYSSDTSCKYTADAPLLSDEQYIEEVTAPAAICSDEDCKENLEDCLNRDVTACDDATLCTANDMNETPLREQPSGSDASCE